LPGLIGYLELHWPLCFLLHHDGAGSDSVAMANIPDPKRDEVTSAEFAVDTEIEQCEFSLAIGQLQPDSDRPYLL
jgi:hypothetical protein